MSTPRASRLLVMLSPLRPAMSKRVSTGPVATATIMATAITTTTVVPPPTSEVPEPYPEPNRDR